MTKHASPDLLDLAEAVAIGELRPADAERRVRAALQTNHGAAERAVRELRTLILATTAVRSHAVATREAAIAESLDLAEEAGSVATVVPSSVRGVRHPSSRNGDGRGPRPRRTWLLVAATVAVGTGVIGASLLGGHAPTPIRQPTVPTTVVQASASLAPTPNVTDAPSPAPAMFAYIEAADAHTDGRLWVANLDGTGAHDLVPDLSGNQQAPVWSPDGTRLLFSRAPAMVAADNGEPNLNFRFYLTDASGTEPQLVDTGCVAPCRADSDAAFSRDGTHLVFVRSLALPPTPENPGMGKTPTFTPASAIATIDLVTGQVVELTSTMIVDCPLLAGQAAPGVPNCEGLQNRHPRWSADGTQIVFTQDVPFDMNDRSMYGDFPPPPGPVLFVVDADGGNLHQIDPRHVSFGDWSPDGALIVFEAVVYKDIVPSKPNGNGWTYTPSTDIYTIRPDGIDLRQLTTDGSSALPSWTTDGRILFARRADLLPWPQWIMDADGGNATQLNPTGWVGLPNQPAITFLTAP
jgi:Tol biopolymer transport system component